MQTEQTKATKSALQQTTMIFGEKFQQIRIEILISNHKTTSNNLPCYWVCYSH